MDKNTVLLRDVIIKHHPEFIQQQELSNFCMKYSEMFNIEKLIEHTLSAVGGYEFVDAAGFDFDDFSDSKTVTINRKTLKGEIGSVENKIGALRITAYNPVKDSVDYFFVPANKLDEVRIPCYGKNKHKQRIVFQYNRIYDHYNQFEKYRVHSFTQLAKLT